MCTCGRIIIKRRVELVVNLRKRDQKRRVGVWKCGFYLAVHVEGSGGAWGDDIRSLKSGLKGKKSVNNN